MPASLRVVLIAVTPLLFATGLVIAGNTLLGTAVSIRLGAEGFAVAAIGAVTAMYSLGFVVGTLVCPILVARVGHIRTFAAFAALAAVATLAYPLHVDAPVWGVLRLVYGLCLAALFTIIESWLNARATNEIRGQVLSSYMAVYFVAAAGGNLALLALAPGEFVLYSVVAMLIAASLVPLALTRIESPPEIPSGRLGIGALVRISPLGVAGCLCSGLVLGAFAALVPIYVLTDDGTRGVALIMTLAIVAGFVVQMPVGRLSDAFDRRRVILGLTAALAIAAALVPFAALGGFWPMLAVIVIHGGLAYSLYPLALAHANDFMKPGELVPAAAGLLLIWGAGAVLGPLLGAATMEAVGPAGLFVFMSAVAVLLAGFILWRMRVRPSLPGEEQQPSVVQASAYTTPAGIELDPRVEIDEPEFDFDGPGYGPPPILEAELIEDPPGADAPSEEPRGTP